MSLFIYHVKERGIITFYVQSKIISFILSYFFFSFNRNYGKNFTVNLLTTQSHFQTQFL